MNKDIEYYETEIKKIISALDYHLTILLQMENNYKTKHKKIIKKIIEIKNSLKNLKERSEFQIRLSKKLIDNGILENGGEKA